MSLDGSMTLTPAQLALLIEAMDWRRTIAPPSVAQLLRSVAGEVEFGPGKGDASANRRSS